MSDETIDWVKLQRELGAIVDQKDRLRRKDMAEWSASRFIARMPWLFMPRMKRVPKQGIEEDTDAEFLLNCPCGHRPILVRERDEFQKCPGCERYYVAFNDAVFVLYGDMPIPAAPAEPGENSEAAPEPDA